MNHREQLVFRNSAAGNQLIQVLHEVVKIDCAAFGNIQVFNCELGGLEVIAQQGFKQEFLDLFKLVMPNDPSVCGRAYRLANRITILDLSNDRYFNPYLKMAQEVGFQAVQSTPVIDSRGCVIGLLSTHFSQTHYLTQTAELSLNHYAKKVAKMLEDFFYTNAPATSLTA